MKRRIITNLKELRKPSQIIENKEEINSIIKDLEDTLILEKGYGLSAIQIGIPKKVSIIRIGKKSLNLINTKILEKNRKFRFQEEGCLSLPGLRIDTLRYKELFIDNNGQKLYFDIETDGILMICIQHELNHFQGKLIIDKEIKWRKR